LNSKRAAIFAFILLFYSVGSPDLRGQINITPGRSEDQISRDDDFYRRNLKTVRSLIKVGNLSRAQELLDILQENFGRIPELIAEQKRIYRELKDYQGLKALILEEIRKNPDEFILTCQLGEVYYLMDSLELALSAWDRAFVQAGSTEGKYIMLASYFIAYGFYDEAASVYRKARVVLGKPQLFALELADIYISQRNYGDAVGEYLNLIEGEPDQTGYILQQIRIMVSEADKPEEIERIITQKISNNPADPELYIILGDINMLNKNFVSAFENYSHADQLKGGTGDYLFHFIRLCYDKNEFEMVVQAADSFLINIEGGNRDHVKLMKARALEKQGYYLPALALLAEIEKGSNGRTAIEATLAGGDIYADRLKDYASARTQFGRVAANRRLYNYANRAKIRLAEIAIIESKYDEAGTLLEELTGVQKDDEVVEKALYLQANIALYNYDFKTAETGFKKIAGRFPSGFYVNDCLDLLSMLSIDADDTVLYYLVDARRLYNAGKTDSAVAKLEQAGNHKGSKAYEQALYMLGTYAMSAGSYEKSVAAYEEYSDSFPEGLYADRVLYNLAELYHEKLSLPHKADELLNRLVTDYPASPLIEKARLYLNKIKSI
jgi:tetratricopeptide (TPR) repeat protein